jgi:RNA polymerase sigma factor (sigma-70 family)
MTAIEAIWTMSKSTLINDAGLEPAPVAAADPLEIIGLLAESVRGRYVQKATVWIGLLGIDEVQFSGEDAFQAALTDLCRRARKGSIEPMRTLEQFRKSFAPRLRECLVDERRRQGAHKRGGGLVVNLLSLVMDEYFDLPDTHIRSPDQHLEAQDQVKWLLSLLDRVDVSLRAVLALRDEGKTNEGIASDLGVSIATVERMFARIRSIWASHVGERMIAERTPKDRSAARVSRRHKLGEEKEIAPNGHVLA